MNFNNSLPEWKNTGTEPSDSLKNDGKETQFTGSRQDIIDGFKETNFDAILAGFEPADLDALLGEKTPDFEEEGEKELSESQVTIQVANYRFRLSQDDFGVWIDKLKQDVGFDKEAVVAEIRRRLAI